MAQTMTLTERDVNRIARRVAELVLEGMAPAKEVLNTAEAAKHLGITTGRLHHLVAGGEVPCYRHGRRLCFRLSELDAWRCDRKVLTRREADIEASTRAAVGRLGAN